MSLAPENGRLRATGTCTRCGDPTSAGSRSCCTTERARDRRSPSRRRSPRFAQAPLALFSPEYGRIESSCTLRTTERQRAPFVMGTFVSAVPAHGDVQIRRLAIEEPLPGPWLGAALSITSPHGDLLILSAAGRMPRRRSPIAVWGPAGVRTDARAVALLRTNAGWRPLSLVDGEQLSIDLPARPVESLPRAAAPALS